MKLIYGLSLGLVLSACAMSPQGEPDFAEQWKELNQKEGVITGEYKAKDGSSTTAFAIHQEVNMNFTRTTTSSETAKACESYAHKSTVRSEWLDICDAAITEPEISTFNRSASRFNKSLILSKLNRTDEARQELEEFPKPLPTGVGRFV